MKKRLLITGASGFLGFHLIRAALDKNLEVYANVRTRSNIDHLKALPIHFVQLDFSSILLLKQSIEENKYDYIIHALGVTKAKNVGEYIKINADYTQHLALASVLGSHKLEKFVFISSLAALGALDTLEGQLDEQVIRRPMTSYGTSKAIAEMQLERLGDLPLIVFRPTAVYGPRERSLLMLIKMLRLGLNVHIGRKTQHLSFVYAEDLAQVVINSLKTSISKRTYNVSDGETYHPMAFATGVLKAMNKKALSLTLPISLVNGMIWFIQKGYSLFKRTPTINVEKLKEITASNWSCNIRNLNTDFNIEKWTSLEEGLLKTINWYKLNKWL